MQSEDLALVLANVSVRFTDERDRSVFILRDISFSLPRGSFTSIAGPSGAGKSTLMRTILGLIKPASGHIVRNYNRGAMVFQNYALFPWLSALENVAYGLKMAGVGREERGTLAREKLKEVGLAHLEDRYPAALSGGQKQRVGLARALAVSPDLLILDEPFSSLDTITAEALKQDLLKLWRQYGMTILMVNHLIPDAVLLSDQVLIMEAKPGRIGKAVDIKLTRPRDPRSDPFYREVDKLTAAIRAVSS
jgi:NitT/TauT family transport system ATP-binding protein